MIKKKEYKLIALDMDGTVLDDKKQILPEVKAAIDKALKVGKQVAFCSGRSYAELKDIVDMFDINYIVGESGALVYNVKENREARAIKMAPEMIKEVFKIVEGRDVMFMPMSRGYDHIQENQIPQLAHYQMEMYHELFSRTSTYEEDVVQYILDNIDDMERLLIFHTSPEEREITQKRIKEADLKVTTTYSEISALEFSPFGVDKGSGLKMLCDEIGISIEEAIMVGDAMNDLAGIVAAGLGVAMGNALDEVKAAADVVVADNNHAGVAEAIEKYLLGE